MFNGSYGYAPSVADIAAVNRGNGGFGGDDGWWALIILFALFGGWGNGFGRMGSGGVSGADVACATAGDVQRGFDTQSIISKLDGVNNGICNLGYDQLAQMNTINSNISNTGFGIQNAITQAAFANLQQTNALSTQLAQCCCENREGQAQIRYDMATDTCAITTAINNAAQQIIQNDNNNYRQLHDEQVALQIQGYKDRIAEQNSVINALNLAASQQAQTTSIVNQLRPTAVPSYQVPNPYTGVYGIGGYNGCCGSTYGGCGFGVA